MDVQRSTLPQRSVSAFLLQPNVPTRSIDDGTIREIRHPFDLPTPPFESINPGLIRVTSTMDTAQGFRNQPQAAHYDVPINKGPMGTPKAPLIFFDRKSTDDSPHTMYNYVDDVCCVINKSAATVERLRQLAATILGTFQMEGSPLYVPSVVHT